VARAAGLPPAQAALAPDAPDAGGACAGAPSSESDR
jgi:hypothetical protein